jgi:hypothetical protein
MKQMQVRFTTSQEIYMFLKDTITFRDVDEYLTSLIEKDIGERK